MTPARVVPVSAETDDNLMYAIDTHALCPGLDPAHTGNTNPGLPNGSKMPGAYGPRVTSIHSSASRQATCYFLGFTSAPR